MLDSRRRPTNHERDGSHSASNTNVLQPAGQITNVNSSENQNELATVGGRVKWARMQRELSQSALAKAANVSQSTIGNIEAGLRKKPRELVQIAKALRANPTWLDSGKGDWQAEDRVPEEEEMLTTDERQLLADFRALLEEEQQQFASEIRTRAERMRAFAVKLLARETPPTPPPPPASDMSDREINSTHRDRPNGHGATPQQPRNIGTNVTPRAPSQPNPRSPRSLKRPK